MKEPKLKRAGAVVAAPSSNVPLSKRTPPNNRKAPLDATAYARAWVARRYRIQTRWAALIAEAAGLGGAAMSGARMRLSAIGPGGAFTVTGQTAKALASLVTAGARGITALEVNSWAYRLGAYVHQLRHKHGLLIETQREPHENGWHGRYVLRSLVRLEAAQ